MTRDEAIKLLDTRQTLAPGQSQSAYAVDALIALGVLKVDEPSIHPEFYNAMARRGYGDDNSLWPALRGALKESGLKLR